MNDELYSLHAVAEQLRVRPATISYWVRTFSTSLSAQATERRPPAFTPQDIAQLHRIRDLALDAGYSVHQIRSSLLSTPNPREAQLTERVEQLLSEVQGLREEITFLAEESKELHRMLALLMQFAWQSGSTAVTLPVGSPNEKKSLLHPHTQNLGINGRTGSHRTESMDQPELQEPTLPWTPPTLG